MAVSPSSAFPDCREKISSFKTSAVAFKEISAEFVGAQEHERFVADQGGTWNPFKSRGGAEAMPTKNSRPRAFEEAQRRARKRAEFLLAERTDTGPAIWRAVFSLLKAIPRTFVAPVTWDLTSWSDFRDSLKPFNQAQREATASREAWEIEYREAIKNHKAVGDELLRVIYAEVISVYRRAIQSHIEHQSLLLSAAANGDRLAEAANGAALKTVRKSVESLHAALTERGTPLYSLSLTAAKSVMRDISPDVQQSNLLRGMPTFIQDIEPGLKYADPSSHSDHRVQESRDWLAMSFRLADLSADQFDETITRIWAASKHAHLLMTAEANLQAFKEELNTESDPAFFQKGVKWTILSAQDDFSGQVVRIACDLAPEGDLNLVHRPMSSIKKAMKEVGIMLNFLEAEALLNAEHVASITDTLETLTRIKSQLSKLSTLNNEDGRLPKARILWTSHPTRDSLSLLSDDLEKQIVRNETDPDPRLSRNTDADAFHR